MSTAEELSEFQRGTIIGCHLSKKSVREISTLLELPQSAVKDVVVKWKRLGITTPLPRMPHKLSNKQLQELERIARENPLSSPTELQSASERSTSPTPDSQEPQEVCDQKTTRKPKSVKRKAKSALKPESKKPVDKKKNAASSNEGNPTASEEDQGHADAQTTSAPTDQPMEAEASTTSCNTEAQGKDVKPFEPFTYVDLNFNSDSLFSFANQSVPTV